PPAGLTVLSGGEALPVSVAEQLHASARGSVSGFAAYHQGSASPIPSTAFHAVEGSASRSRPPFHGGRGGCCGRFAAH
uniref:hypothetical protein n=1 Tax=Streptomyces albidoflavus TaxID=1886 RepID=UPI001C8F861A